eukprot:450510-Amorphochlora_amoeboformis.AAC.1
MSALELMDPKMDPGMKQKNSEGKEVDFKHLDPKTVRMDLSLPELIAQSLPKNLKQPHRADVRVHTSRVLGARRNPAALERVHALSVEALPHGIQPTATGYHMANFYLLSNQAMFVHLLQVRNVVMRADIYEEEDFTANVFGFELGTNSEKHCVLILIAKLNIFAPL